LGKKGRFNGKKERGSSRPTSVEKRGGLQYTGLKNRGASARKGGVIQSEKRSRHDMGEGGKI